LFFKILHFICFLVGFNGGRLDDGHFFVFYKPQGEIKKQKND